ncbi:Na+/H+ antiporter subunit E [Chamaesiphon minutus]|uniref:Multisubunit Na+/H+ antiporter, MnhE subunit n=1 Tax=Chamaesiphon minutus (strain ATCC 27169 / PCC 6605) TaxID=1173020 RepID=K9UM68_CHAP6|nr:Na+/H+ antiporter subunit E [Chamaesiphon minutus]AFY95910.1 multisubunit Na+/H+ antiporter, MnhE subunit [Chamaesiphon minutus PCC 6605]
MSGYLNIILRLTIWLLLTSDLSPENIAIGIVISLILPRNHRSIPHSGGSTNGTLRDWLRVFGKIVMAIPIAYIEAIEMIFRPHQAEDIEIERVPPNRSSGLVFLDIFLITFTPKTIVRKYDRDGGYEVHRVKRRRNL